MIACIDSWIIKLKELDLILLDLQYLFLIYVLIHQRMIRLLNTSPSPAYGLKSYISSDMPENVLQFLSQGKLLTNKLLIQEFQQTRLKATLGKFFCRCHDLVCPYNLSNAVEQVPRQSL